MEIPDKSQPAAEPKKVKQVIPDGGAQKVGRPASKRLMNFLVAESPKEVAKNVGINLVIPQLKAAFEAAANGFISGLLWNNSGRPSGGIVQGTVLNSNTSVYGGVVNGGVSPAQLAAAAAPQRPSGYQDLKLPTQQYAEALLTNMYQLLNEYRMVSVADLYESAGMPTDPQDHKIGWMALDGVHIEKTRDPGTPGGVAFVLALPRPIRL